MPVAAQVAAQDLREALGQIKHQARGICAICRGKTRLSGSDRAWFCDGGCGCEVHARCALPGMPARMAGGGYTCEDCLEYELETGDDEAKGDWAKLWQEGMQLESEARADNTHANYNSAMASLAAFLEGQGMDADLALRQAVGRGPGGESASTLSSFWRSLFCYVSHMSRRNKVGSCHTYLNGGIADHFRSNGVPVGNCPTKHWRIKRAMKGWKHRVGFRDEDGGVRRAEAMDEELLWYIVDDLLNGRMLNERGDGPMSEFEARQAAIVLLLAFSAMLRRGEVAGLRTDKLRRTNAGFEVVVSGAQYRRAKSDQAAKGQTTRVPSVVLGFDLAALVREHKAELRSMGLADDALLFRNVLKPGKAAWEADGEAVNKLLKKLVAQTVGRHGLLMSSGAHYSSHSLRRGGAQYLRDRGVPKELVKIMGRWRSDAVDAYFDTVAAKAMDRVAAVFSKLGV